MKTYQDVIEHYIKHHQKNGEKENRYFEIQRNLSDVIRIVSYAITPSGKRFHHQRRLPKHVLRKCHFHLANKRHEIKRCNKFHDLIELFNNSIGNIKGVGELMVYDSALRLGAFLKLKPDRIYLHAGTRQGAKYMGLDLSKGYLEKKMLPNIFNKLKPYQIEDILCIYKNEIRKINKKNGLTDQDRQNRGGLRTRVRCVG